MHSNPSIKILVVGNSNSGKAKLIYRVSDNKWSDKFTSKLAMDMRVLEDYRIDKWTVDLHLYNYSALAENFKETAFRMADCIIVAVDLTTDKAQEQIDYWLNKVEAAATRDLQVAIVGTKSDLVANQSVKFIHTQRNGVVLHNRENELYPVSAKTGAGIRKMLSELVEPAIPKRSIRIKQAKMTLKKDNCV